MDYENNEQEQWTIPKLNSKQESYLNSVFNNKYSFMIGGYGGGKTFANVLAVFHCAFYWCKGFDGGLLGPTIGNLKKNFIPLWESLIDKSWYSIVWGDNPHIVCYHEDCEPTKILLLSAATRDRIEGANLAYGGIEESQLIPKEIYDVFCARVRIKEVGINRIFGVGLPVSNTWLEEEFVINRNLIEYGGKYKWIKCNAIDNQDNLKDGYLEDLKETMDSNAYESKGLGNFAKQTGLVYGDFSMENIDDSIKYNPMYPVYIGQDYNLDRMSSVIVQFIENEILVLGETYGQVSVKDHMPALNDTLNELGIYEDSPNNRKSITIVGDCSGRHRNQNDGFSNVSLLESVYTVKSPKKNPSITSRDNALRLAIRNKKGVVRLKVHPRCKQVIKSFRGLRVENRKKADLDHILDALGYIAYYLVPYDEEERRNYNKYESRNVIKSEFGNIKSIW